jgi:hypothetical protein
VTKPKPETGNGYSTKEPVIRDVQLSRKFDKANASLKALMDTGKTEKRTKFW